MDRGKACLAVIAGTWTIAVNGFGNRAGHEEGHIERRALSDKVVTQGYMKLPKDDIVKRVCRKTALCVLRYVSRGGAY